jgi:hypothetical protein
MEPFPSLPWVANAMISLLSANYQTGGIVSMTETLGLALLGGAADLGHGQCDDTCPPT